ncbi:MAG: hypothetical protein ACKVK3_03275 [Acidimicrobiales bacterium]
MQELAAPDMVAAVLDYVAPAPSVHCRVVCSAVQRHGTEEVNTVWFGVP